MSERDYDYVWPDDLPEDTPVSPFNPYDVCVPFPRTSTKTLGATHVYPPIGVDEVTGERWLEFEDIFENNQDITCCECGAQLTAETAYMAMSWETHGGQIADSEFTCAEHARHVQNRLRHELRSWHTWNALIWHDLRQARPGEESDKTAKRVARIRLAYYDEMLRKING